MQGRFSAKAGLEELHKTQNAFANWLPHFDWKLILLCCAWYLTSVISTSSAKMILREYTYPVTLTEIQFIMNIFYCIICVYTIKKIDHLISTYRHSGLKAHRSTFDLTDYEFSKNRSPYTLSTSVGSQQKQFSLLSCFPKGTFPETLNSYDYSLIEDFFHPSLLLLKATIPMGVFQFMGQIANNKATSLIPVSIVHTIKALSPLSTVLLYAMVFKRKFSRRTYLTLVPLILGVMLSCTKLGGVQDIQDSNFNIGCMFAFVSMLIFVSQNVFAKKFLTYDSKQQRENYFNIDTKSFKTSPTLLPVSMPVTPLYGNSTQSLNKFVNDSEMKLDKVSVLFYCSIVGFILTIPVYVLAEVTSPAFSLLEINKRTAGLMVIYGIAHFMQSIVAFQILGQISPINYSIANIIKRIIVISWSIFIEGTQLSNIQQAGLLLTFSGLYAYDRWGVQRKS